MIRWTNTKGGVQFLFIYFSLYLVFKIVQNWHSTLGRVGAVLQSIFFSLTTATFSFQDKSSGHQNEMLILIGKLYLSYVLKYFPYYNRLCCLDDLLLCLTKITELSFCTLGWATSRTDSTPCSHSSYPSEKWWFWEEWRDIWCSRMDFFLWLCCWF